MKPNLQKLFVCFVAGFILVMKTPALGMSSPGLYQNNRFLVCSAVLREVQKQNKMGRADKYASDARRILHSFHHEILGYEIGEMNPAIRQIFTGSQLANHASGIELAEQLEGIYDQLENPHDNNQAVTFGLSGPPALRFIEELSRRAGEYEKQFDLMTDGDESAEELARISESISASGLIRDAALSSAMSKATRAGAALLALMGIGWWNGEVSDPQAVYGALGAAVMWVAAYFQTNSHVDAKESQFMESARTSIPMLREQEDFWFYFGDQVDVPKEWARRIMGGDEIYLDQYEYRNGLAAEWTQPAITREKPFATRVPIVMDFLAWNRERLPYVAVTIRANIEKPNYPTADRAAQEQEFGARELAPVKAAR